jgi:hypothetical protein
VRKLVRSTRPDIRPFPKGWTVFEAPEVEKVSHFRELGFVVSVERGGKRKPRATMKAENLAIDAIRGSSLSSLADIPHSMEFNLFKTLDGLINGWCERRELRPLYLLRVYPGVLAHTDKQFQLLEALKNLKRLCRDYLTPEELRLVTQAHNFLEERLLTRII